MNYRAKLNGRVLADFDKTGAEVEQISSGVYSVLQGGKSFLVHASGQNGAYEVNINGYTFSIELEDPRDAASSSNSSELSGKVDVKSAMPGKVVRVLVSVGDMVEAGQSLVVVEAMKMQNDLKSPKTGCVKKVNTSEGSTVQAGQVLVVLE